MNSVTPTGDTKDFASGDNKHIINVSPQANQVDRPGASTSVARQQPESAETKHLESVGGRVLGTLPRPGPQAERLTKMNTFLLA
ncbi:hypothetical protein SRHO_G00293850 [Serrasalmus rhombeus]